MSTFNRSIYSCTQAQKKSLCDKFEKLPYSKNPNGFVTFPLPFSTEQQNHPPGRSYQKTKHCQSFADIIHFWTRS